MSQVSVLMPLKNAEMYVEEAISSILRSDSPPVEIVVIDDASTDNSRSRIERLGDSRVRVISNRGAGISSALNVGLESAQGKFVARCDADDRYAISRLAEQVEFLEAHPHFGAVCAGFSMIRSKGEHINDLISGTDIEITSELRSGMTRTSLCTFLIRRDIVMAVGGFREFFRSAEDIDFQLRLSESCRIFYKAKSVYDYRLHDGSITHSDALARNLYFENTARLFQQQRIEAGLDDLQAGRAPPPFVASSLAPRRAADHAQAILIGLAWQHHTDGDRWKALTVGLRAAMQAPLNLRIWQSVAALAVKQPKSS